MSKKDYPIPLTSKGIVAMRKPIITISPAGFLQQLHFDLTVMYAVCDITDNRLIAVFTNEEDARKFRRTYLETCDE